MNSSKGQLNVFNREIKNKSLPKTVKNNKRYSPKRHTHLREERYVNHIYLYFSNLLIFI